jgi:hypothetical protein
MMLVDGGQKVPRVQDTTSPANDQQRVVDPTQD